MKVRGNQMNAEYEDVDLTSRSRSPANRRRQRRRSIGADPARAALASLRRRTRVDPPTTERQRPSTSSGDELREHVA
jgi:hypothetical protein